MNRITDPETLAAINPENARLSADYLDYLRSIQRAASTIEVYKNDLDIAWVFALKRLNNKFFVNWTKRDVISFQNWLVNEHKNSPARVRRIKATLSSLSNYIESILDDEYKEFRNIIHKVESPVSQPVREKTVLQEDQLVTLLDTLISKKQYKKACALALAMYSGRRKSELVRFKVSYFDDENIIFGSLYKTPETIRTKGRGKGKYIYCYTLAKKFKPYLDYWLAQRKELGVESDWLFPDPSDPTEPMNVSTLDSYAQTFSRMLGVDFYFHSMRHYFTTALVRTGLPDSVIQDIIGWSSAEMLRIYTDIPVDEQLGKWFSDGEVVSNNTNISCL